MARRKEIDKKIKKGTPGGGDSADDCGEQSSSSESEQSSASGRSDEDAAPRRRVQGQVRPASQGNKRSRLAGRQWAVCVSARSNQDQQRRYEERAARHMRTALARRAPPAAKAKPPAGGVYARLEAEWRERHGTNARARSAVAPRARPTKYK